MAKDKKNTTAPESNDATNRPRNRRGLILIIGLLIVSLSTMTTLVIYALTTGKFDVNDIGEASYTCEDAIKRKYGDQIVTMYFDGLSSFYEPDTNNYVVFYRVNARMRDDPPLEISEILIKCIVKETFGFVVTFDAFKLGSHYSG